MNALAPVTIDIKKTGEMVLSETKNAHRELDVARSFEIDSEEMNDHAAAELRSIVAKRKALEDQRMALTRPIDEHKKQIIALFATPIEALNEVENVYRGAVGKWLRLERERVAEEQRKAEEIRKREAAAAQAKLDEARNSGANNAELDVLEAETALMEVSTTVLPQEIKKTAGVSVTSTWKVKSINKEVLIKAAAKDRTLQAYLEIDEAKLNKVVKSLGAEFNVPGVEFHQVETLSVRR